MSNLLLVNSTPQESRVALVESGVVAEFYVERSKDHSVVGNIYKGRVIRVLPGIQAAFVDIGLDRAAFLYVTDVGTPIQTDFLEDSEADDGHLENVDAADEDELEIQKDPHTQTKPIQELLSEGQEIVVQVAKAPIGTKGARITSQISLPGRNLVLIPSIDHIGISRRIQDEKERERLRTIVESIKPTNVGIIVRTVCEGKKESDLREDMEFLLRVWEKIWQSNQTQPSPSLLHKDLDLVLKATRDLFTPVIDRLVVDDPKEHSRMKGFIETFLPKMKASLELFQGNEALFEAFNIEGDIARALGRKVWLKSGGYIVIDQMEALTAIDVNTGRFVGKTNLEDTILKTNLEAVREVAIQLRLRNIGGIIIVDFIDMTKKSNRDRVFSAFEDALKKDRAKTNILKISEFGLLEMTRKRTQDSLVRSLCSPCPYCEGKAYVKSPQTVAYEVLRTLNRDLKREANSGKKPTEFFLHVHPKVAEILSDEERGSVEQLEKLLPAKISIKVKQNFHLEHFEIIEK